MQIYIAALLKIYRHDGEKERKNKTWRRFWMTFVTPVWFFVTHLAKHQDTCQQHKTPDLLLLSYVLAIWKWGISKTAQLYNAFRQTHMVKGIFWCFSAEQQQNMKKMDLKKFELGMFLVPYKLAWMCQKLLESWKVHAQPYHGFIWNAP